MPPDATTDANCTARLIASRLPRTPLVTPGDIARACGMASTNAVRRAIVCGKLSACRIGGRFMVARTEALRWIELSAILSDEIE